MSEEIMIVGLLSELLEDQNVPRNVRSKFEEVVSLLQNENDQSVKIHEALNILETVSSDVNLESYTRTQVFSVVSMLEGMHN